MGVHKKMSDKARFSQDMAVIDESRYEPTGIYHEILGRARGVDVDKSCLKLDTELANDN